MSGGAQSSTNGSLNSIVDDEWNFSTTAAFDQEISKQSTAQDVYDAYSTTFELQETSRPQFQRPSRRRPPPHALTRLPAPLEKIFDPDTLSNYEEKSRNHYGRPLQQPITYVRLTST
jgi:hypothetical protein